jgi:phage shock protein PspC (stress-responsive transcriptional regulator)
MPRPGCGSIVGAMTETTSPSNPPAGSVRAPRRLYRDPDDDMFAGVCAALARYTDTDPVIWRIATVVLAVLGGGTGIALYVLGWILIPKLGEDRSIGESWLQRPEGRLTAKTIVLIAIAIIVIVWGLGDGRGVGAVAVLAAVGYLAYRERQGRPMAPSYHPVPGAPAPPPIAPTAATPWTAPPPIVRVPRARSRLGLVTVSLAAVLSGILVWASQAGVHGLAPGRIIAIALLVVGAGLVLGTWFGRARWLVAVGLLLSLAVGGAFAADAAGATLHGGVGERSWVVNQSRIDQGYTLGVGEATLDLSQLPSDGPHIVVHTRVSLGHLIVVVPDDVPVRLHAKLRIGDITEFGNSLVNGSDNIERTRTYGPAGDPRIEIEATMGTGQIEVRHG